LITRVPFGSVLKSRSGLSILWLSKKLAGSNSASTPKTMENYNYPDHSLYPSLSSASPVVCFIPFIISFPSSKLLPFPFISFYLILPENPYKNL